MRILKSLSPVLCTLLAVVLFSMTVSVAMASPKDYPGRQAHLISKKGSNPANSDNQLPYEEKETEKDDEFQDNFSLVCLISEPIYFLPLSDQGECFEKAPSPIKAVTEIPLYLSQRVLLI